MRFKLEKSAHQQDWWVLTDTDNNVVIRFEQGRYNETQKVSILSDGAVTERTPGELAKAIREMGEYVVKYHGDIAFSAPYGFKIDEETNRVEFYRNKSPKWLLRADQLAATLIKAAEFLKKR